MDDNDDNDDDDDDDDNDDVEVMMQKYRDNFKMTLLIL